MIRCGHQSRQAWRQAKCNLATSHGEVSKNTQKGPMRKGPASDLYHSWRTSTPNKKWIQGKISFLFLLMYLKLAVLSAKNKAWRSEHWNLLRDSGEKNVRYNTEAASPEWERMWKLQQWSKYGESRGKWSKEGPAATWAPTSMVWTAQLGERKLALSVGTQSAEGPADLRTLNNDKHRFPSFTHTLIEGHREYVSPETLASGPDQGQLYR